MGCIIIIIFILQQYRNDELWLCMHLTLKQQHNRKKSARSLSSPKCIWWDFTYCCFVPRKPLFFFIHLNRKINVARGGDSCVSLVLKNRKSALLITGRVKCREEEQVWATGGFWSSESRLLWSTDAIRITVKMGDVAKSITSPQNFKCQKENGSTVENEKKSWDFKNSVLFLQFSWDTHLQTSKLLFVVVFSLGSDSLRESCSFAAFFIWSPRSFVDHPNQQETKYGNTPWILVGWTIIPAADFPGWWLRWTATLFLCRWKWTSSTLIFLITNWPLSIPLPLYLFMFQ